MKGFRKLLKDFWHMQATLIGLGVFLLVIVIVAGFRMRSEEDLFWMLLIYIIFAGLAIFATLIYDIVIMIIYFNARNKLRALPGFSEERFEREVQRMPRINSMILCCDAIGYVGSCTQPVVIPIADIVWAYQEDVQNLPVLQIHTKDKQKHTVTTFMKKKYGNREMASRYILRLIARKNKGALIGYKEQYDILLKNDFNSLVQMTQGKEIVDSMSLEQEYIQNNYYVKDLQ